MSHAITESEVEQGAFEILEELEYKALCGPEIAPAPEGTRPERKSYSDVFLVERLARAIDKLDPGPPEGSEGRSS